MPAPSYIAQYPEPLGNGWAIMRVDVVVDGHLALTYETGPPAPAESLAAAAFRLDFDDDDLEDLAGRITAALDDADPGGTADVSVVVVSGLQPYDLCPGCQRVMSRREASEQGACNDCHAGWTS